MKAPTGSQVVGRVRSGRDLAARATGVNPMSPTSRLCMTRRTCLGSELSDPVVARIYQTDTSSASRSSRFHFIEAETT